MLSEELLLSKLIFPVQGWLTDEEAYMLFRCAEDTKKDIMEIGGYKC